MDSDKRREEVLENIRKSPKPITGSRLAKMFNVTRQVIVQDIAILRAGGENIIATPQGYMIPRNYQPQRYKRVIACKHLDDGMEDELNTIVDLGGTVIDVIVEHQIYGEFKAQLMIGSPSDVRNFIGKMRQEGAEPLSSLTEGVHLHTIEADSPELLDKIEEALDKKEILLDRK